MARAQSYLWCSGGSLILVSLLLTRAPGTNLAGMIGVAILALLVAGILWGGQRYLPQPLLSPTVALGSFCITLLMWFDGSASSVYALFYVWPAMYAFYFFSRREAAAHGVAIAVFAALEMAIREPVHPPVGRWMVIVGTVIVAGVWTQHLVEALRESQETLRGLTGDLEERVQERTAQAAASNAELADFSYAVGHDLRAPLRAIYGFSRILGEERSDLTPDDAQRYLEMIGRNANDMGNLIDGLLDFSRLTRRAIEKTTVNPTDVARETADRLMAGLAGRRVDIRISEMPLCQSDPLFLGLVYTNLLDNALKFSPDRELTRVEVGYIAPEASGRNQPVYYVKDFGIGFDMRYADKLFGLFQRLHAVGEFEGKGAGLAMVRRIVQRHGGEAWAEAEPAKGATFYFTLGEE